MTHKNKDRKSRQKIIREFALPGMGLELGFEDDNPVDPRAVAALIPDVGQIGYLDARLAGEVRDWHAAGKGIAVTITEVTGGDAARPNFGVNIEIEVFPAP